MTPNGGLLTSLGVNRMPRKERLRRCEERFLHDNGTVPRRKVSLTCGGGSVTRDRSGVPRGGDNELKNEVTQMKTRR